MLVHLYLMNLLITFCVYVDYFVLIFFNVSLVALYEVDESFEKFSSSPLRI